MNKPYNLLQLSLGANQKNMIQYLMHVGASSYYVKLHNSQVGNT